MLPAVNRASLPYRSANRRRRRGRLVQFLAMACGMLLFLLLVLLGRQAVGMRPLLAVNSSDTRAMGAGVNIQIPRFHPGQLWTDQNGSPLQAHGGGILLHKGVYYWYGEDKGHYTYLPQAAGEGRYVTQRVDVIGVRCYSSTDLQKWRDEGLVLRAGQHPDLNPDRVLERPKVIYNAATRRFVMWMHIDDMHYAEAHAGVAWSTSPTGPFHYIGSSRPDGQMSRDMNLFQDDDGRAWLLSASENNQVLHISQLSEDYLAVQPQYSRAMVGLAREAPAAFKHQGLYFIISSACTGWAPNRAEVFVAPAMEGPWRSLGDPCKDPDPSLCATFFQSQDTYVLPVPGHEGRGHFIMMADRWLPEDLGNSRYIWLPLWVSMQPSDPLALGTDLEGGGLDVTVRWYDEWGYDVFDREPYQSGGVLPEVGPGRRGHWKQGQEVLTA